MKGTTIRNLLISATLLGVVGAAGVGLAHPRSASPPGAAKPGERAGKPADPAARPDLDQDWPQITVTSGRGRLGVSVLQISADLRTHLGAPADRGVLVDAVRPDSPAARAGVRAGDVLVEVDGEAARSATDILDAMADRKKGEAVKIEAIRDRGPVSLAATLVDDPGPREAVGRGGRGAGGPGFGPWPRGMPELDLGGDLQRQLDEARRRIDELERRLDKQGSR